MKFGMPTLVECDTLSDCVKVCRECGLDFIEINMSFPQYTKSGLDTEEAVRLANENGLFYTIHADEALNPFDFNEKVSDCYFDVMADTIEVAKAIGCKVINLHLQKGIYVTLPGKVILLTDVYHDQYLNTVKKFISMCEEKIGDSGIVIAIENVDSNAFTSSQLLALELFMKSPVFGLTLDTGHEMALNFADIEVFKKYPEKLLHMHLHDCVGKKPHLALGDGEVDIKEKLSQLKYGETCLVEVKTIEGLHKSVKYLNENSIK